MGSCILCKSNAIINEQNNASRKIYNCPACGVFVVSDLAEKEVHKKSGEIMAFLTSRRLAKKSDTLLISFEKANLDKDYLQMTVDQIVALHPKSFAEQMNMALKNIGFMSKFPGDEVKIDDIKMAPYFYILNESYEALNFLVKSLWKENLIEVNYFSGSYFPCGVVITASGWNKLYELQENGIDRDILFFCAPRTENDISQQFIKAVNKVAVECGFKSAQNTTGRATSKITNELIAGIKTSGAVICDLTELSGEAYYTAALAKGLGKLCIMTCHESVRKKLQIDTDQLSVIFWDKQESLHMELLNALKAGM